MDEAERRERALRQLVTLDKLGEGTTPEAENARTRAKELRTKYNIPERRATQPPPRPRPNTTHTRSRATDEEVNRMYDDLLRRAREREAAERRAEEQRKRMREETMARRRAEAQAREAEAARARMRATRMTEEERREAQRDPFTWAQQQDSRTHAQRQADLNAARGQQERAVRDFEQRLRCSTPETFYDSGGKERPRNVHVIDCDRCGVRLQPGEGTIMKIADRWIGRCCEKVPGPRRRRDGFREGQ